MARRVLSSKERYQIANLLREHTERVDDDHVRYQEGWSDQRIMQEVGGGVSLDHVKRFRREALGELPASKGRHNTIEKVAHLERQIDLVISRYNLLAVAAGYPELGINPEDRP